MDEQLYDVAILGSGPGGYVAAIRAAQHGLRVALIERDTLGGVCLNWGCIPSKALVKSAELYYAIKSSAEYGVHVHSVSFDFPKIITRSREVVHRVTKGLEYLIKKNQIDFINGVGRLVDKNTLHVKGNNGDRTIRARSIIIATGARPKTLPGVAFDGKKVLSSTDAMLKTEVPDSLLIVGGGAIGNVFAYFFNAFGTKVTIVESMSTLLPMEERENVQILERNFRRLGITIITETTVESIEVDNTVNVTVTTSEGKKIIPVSAVLVAIGVLPNIENIGLEEVGIRIQNGYVTTNEYMQTNVENIYAIGDVAGAPMLAHKASHEGIVAADHIAKKPTRGIDRTTIPSCTFCQPQVASVGLTEKAAQEHGYRIKVGRFPFRALGKAVASGDIEGQVKLIFDELTGKLLGAHIVGSYAAEMIAEASIAKALSATWYDIQHTIHVHPTLSEAIMEAAGQAFGVSIHI
ncbi:MAG: dihydrolipoyl dehydrogenase [Bacteroidetes bacterium]|nr:dihydrolipoyl dehydrogenase [Bacteroidota bacterium]